MPPRSTRLLSAVLVAGGVALTAVEASAAASLAARLAPVLAFVAALSVVVNIASQLGVFHVVAGGIDRLTPSACGSAVAAGWVVVLTAAATIFLSLDTAALLVTPLAVLVARRHRLPVLPMALAVVWVANIGSLLLPVSNLTNLLAEGGGYFSSTADFFTQAHRVGFAVLAVALVAVGAAFAASRGRVTSGASMSGAAISGASSRSARWALVILAVLIPALFLPVPYWVPAGAAAGLMALVCWAGGPDERQALRWSLIPWNSLLLTAAMSVLATLAITLVGAEHLRALIPATGGARLFAVGGLGAVSANVLNNLPAYFLVEPAAEDVRGALALLVGVNAGAIVTPWASLATLLWHDQLARSGVTVRWSSYVMYGLMLAPFAVGLPIAALL